MTFRAFRAFRFNNTRTDKEQKTKQQQQQQGDVQNLTGYKYKAKQNKQGCNGHHDYNNDSHIMQLLQFKLMFWGKSIIVNVFMHSKKGCVKNDTC